LFLLLLFLFLLLLFLSLLFPSDPPSFVVQMATNMELLSDYPGADNAQVLPIQ